MNNVIVTTGDIKQEYTIIGPVYFQVSNKGLFSTTLNKLIDKYSKEISDMKYNKLMSEYKSDWGFIYGEWSVGQNDFEKAFFVAVQELKIRAKILGANAIICMKQDIDLDTTAFQHFYLQMYGTAVRIHGIEIEQENNEDDNNLFEICPNCKRKSEKRYNICEYCNMMKR